MKIKEKKCASQNQVTNQIPQFSSHPSRAQFVMIVQPR